MNILGKILSDELAAELFKSQLHEKILELLVGLEKKGSINRNTINVFVNFFHTFIDSAFIPFIEDYLKVSSNSISKEQQINRVIETVGQCKGQFFPFSSEHRRFEIYGERFMFSLTDPYEIVKKKWSMLDLV